MSQLTSLRAARAALNHPSVRRNRRIPPLLRGDVTGAPGVFYHQPTTSIRCIGSTATSSGFVDRRSGHPGPSTLLRGTHHVQWHPSLIRTTHCMMSTSITDSNKDGNSDGSANTLSDTVGSEGKIMDPEAVDKSIPFKRSKRDEPQTMHGSGFDDRAQAKLTTLSTAKKEAEGAKAAFLASIEMGTAHDDATELREQWNHSEQKLALAYSQAIKYTSRIPKNPEATKVAETLLMEWMDRFMGTFGTSLSWADLDKQSKSGPSAHLNKTKLVRTIHKVISTLVPSESSSEATSPSAPQVIDDTPSTLPKVRVPPPTAKDYTNLLRAYSSSKARRKGQQCESLMKNMVRLVKTVAHCYDEKSGKSTDDNVYDTGMEPEMSVEGSETKRWKSWVIESIPTSKAFVLAIKCHSGTTHKESLDRIFLLNEIHDGFSRYCQAHVPGIHQDDPYVLFHSIKALNNLQKKDQMDKGQEWLRRLHKFVTSPGNANYFKETEIVGEAAADVPVTDSETIDVTSAYTSMLRLLARLRGADGAASEARKVLNRMHRVDEVYRIGLLDPDSDSKGAGRIASVDIRSNAYDLVLGLHRDSRKQGDAVHAVELLQKMIDAGNEDPEHRGGIPLPTEQSFEYTILSLANMADAERAMREAERLIELMQQQEHLDLSVSAYNAFITVCSKQLFGKPSLFDKAIGILNEMNETSKTVPEVAPNADTLSFVMKACSLAEHDDHGRVLDTATKLFSQLEEQEENENSAVALTDRAYFYMMKCVGAHMIGDSGAKKERIEGLFSDACQRGLCSANVLSVFRNSVSAEEYRLTVGEGRLADHWIANITGPRALYTDGSQGGAGKHARRKGKSTSDWVKKKKLKEKGQEAKRKDKAAKKFYKRMAA